MLKHDNANNDWTTESLADVCSILTCGVASTPKYVDESEGIPFLSAQNVKNGRVILHKYKYISKEFHEKLTKKNKPCKGDILYSRVGAKYGEAGVVEHDFEYSVYVSVTLIRGIPEKINNYFLKYFLNSPEIKKLAKDSITSSGVPNLNVKSVREFSVRYPSLETQKQIVAKLDQAFADIEKAKVNAEQNLNNARELFDSYLNNVFNQKGDGWSDACLSDICENLDNKRIPITKKDRKEGDFPYYGASGIVDYVDSFIFDENLLLVSEDGANLLARTYPIAFSASGKYWVNNHAHVLKFNNRYVQKFIEYYLNSISLAPYITGMAQPKLNQRALNNLPVPNVSNAIAEAVVNDLIELEKEILTLKSIYKKKLASLKELKQSILQKAFNGELA